ncbi:MAG: 50S ribosomal protein L7/L12 [Cytophagales bacterium]
MEATQEKNPKIEKLAESIVNLKIKEVQELLDCLKEQHGIEPVAVAAPQAVVQGGPAAEQKEEKDIFEIVLKSVPTDKVIKVVKALRKITGEGLRECKGMVDNAPSTVKENVPKAEAEAMQKQLKEAGGEVELK